MSARLEALRQEIERIDGSLVRLVSRRVELARAAGEEKRRLELPTLDPKREAEVVRRAGELARRAGLDAEEVRELFWRVIGLSRRDQSGR
ncbi:MAG: chorismate mutase [Longimicrobiaceae bacterium]